jgi:hypothetical protein
MEVRMCEGRERAGGEDHNRPRASRVFALFANLPQTPPRDILSTRHGKNVQDHREYIYTVNINPGTYVIRYLFFFFFPFAAAPPAVAQLSSPPPAGLAAAAAFPP